MDILQHLFERHFQTPLVESRALQDQLGGSGRRIIRLIGKNAHAVGILYEVHEENVAFLEFSRHFRRHGLRVPEIYAEDLAHGAYLEQDLGDTTLFDFLIQHRRGERIDHAVVEAYRQALSILPRFQVEAGRDLNYKVCYPRSSFDRQSIAWDLNYFKYYFLRLAGIPFNEQALEQDFVRLTKFLLSTAHEYFLYRDFQSRNIMLKDGELFFLDYQGGRKGALQYDVASLLYDAKADLPPELRWGLLEHYLNHLAEFVPLERDAFIEHYYGYVYVRIMQALGAYGFRGFYERKAHFLQSVPYALKNLRWLLHNVHLPIALPTLMEAFQAMLGSEKLQNLSSLLEADGLESTAEPKKLVVRIFSFSFHGEGLPKDETGNGGGFVFDGRSLPNPGREARFKDLTGKDQAVAEYLDQQGSVRQFLASVSSLVDTSVREYQRRGFKNLMVSFGCTGGQHRSVYLAEQLAKHLRLRNGVEIVLRHRAREAGQMKAMILAAGLGTRLHPLTNDRPKALVEISGHTLLEITLARLRVLGIEEVIVNVHHFAELVIDYLRANKNFGMRIEISREETLLDTGGGLKKTAWFFQDSDSEEPFLLHNVDVISTIDLHRMMEFHVQERSLATLAVQERKTSRYLLFDHSSRLCGRRSHELTAELVCAAKPVRELAFCGIHVISPRLFHTLSEKGAFSIISAYLRLAAEGESIVGFRADGYYWRDVGKPEHIAQAEQDLRRHVLPQSFTLPV